jgi:arylsulfatase A-like enzyme
MISMPIKISRDKKLRKFFCYLYFLILFGHTPFLGLLQIHASKNNQNFVIFVNHDHAVSTWNEFKDLKPTKNLDALSAKGIFFKNAFCSNGSSGPGSATILTGKHAHGHGLVVNGQSINADQDSMPKILMKQNYDSAVFGRWDLNEELTGFTHWDVLADSEEFYNPTFISKEGKRQIEGHSTDIITDLLIQWIQGRKTEDKPFFAIVFFNGTQRPWMPTLRQLETFNDILLPEPSSLYSEQKDLAPASRYQQNEIQYDLNLTNDLFLRGIEYQIENSLRETTIYEKNVANMNEEQSSSWQLLWRPRNEAYLREVPTNEELLRWKYQRFAKNYLRCITDIDENIGRFKSFYEKCSKQQCIFIYTANQGRFVGENGWFGSQWMMDKSMRVPLIVSSLNGNVIPNKVITENVQDIDIAPTILNIIGAGKRNEIHGIALNSNDWNSSEVRKREALYFHHYHFPDSNMIARHNGIRTKNFKLIHYYQFGEWELFDLTNDPNESKNCSNSSTQFMQLKHKLSIFEKAFGDQAEKALMPEKWRRIYRGPSARSK